MSGNTKIQILRSYANTAPQSLIDGQLAYSFVSNVMFIGNSSNGVINVGGSYYTTMLDNATTLDTANTLVLRDSNGTANIVLTSIDGGQY